MSGLRNPMRFGLRMPRSIDIEKYLGDDKRVTSIGVDQGSIYVHWEEV